VQVLSHHDQGTVQAVVVLGNGIVNDKVMRILEHTQQMRGINSMMPFCRKMQQQPDRIGILDSLLSVKCLFM